MTNAISIQVPIVLLAYVILVNKCAINVQAQTI